MYNFCNTKNCFNCLENGHKQKSRCFIIDMDVSNIDNIEDDFINYNNSKINSKINPSIIIFIIILFCLFLLWLDIICFPEDPSRIRNGL